MRTFLLFFIAAALLGVELSSNDHVQWKRDFARFKTPFFLQGAGADAEGNLWVLTSAFTQAHDYSSKQTFFHIDGSGMQQSAVDIEAPIPRAVSMDRAEYYPALTAAGPVGFLLTCCALMAASVSRVSRSTLRF